MMRKRFMFNSESVTEGHPDKLCDQISDAIVGEFLRQDPRSSVMAECGVATGIVFIAVKYLSDAIVDVPEVARSVISSAGYIENGFSPETCTIMTSMDEMQNDTRESVADLDQVPAREQANVFGFACSHTAVLMPLPIWLSHQLARRLAFVRKEGILPYLSPDGKAQVGVAFEDGKPIGIHSLNLLASVKEGARIRADRLRNDVIEQVIEPVFERERVRIGKKTRISVNPGAQTLFGGPSKHSGLTGRKTAVDTYGEYARHSGAAMSGKDPSRIDRVGVYIARYAAKNVVAAGLADQCEIQVSYALGLADPVSIKVETFGTGQLPDEVLSDKIREIFDFRPAAIVRNFGLRELPRKDDLRFYPRLAAYGQVGRTDLELPWERTDQVERLREAVRKAS